jgi:hypothetical protein
MAVFSGMFTQYRCNCINDGAISYPELSQHRNIMRTDALGSIRQPHNETEHGTQLLADRSDAPVSQYLARYFVSQQ